MVGPSSMPMIAGLGYVRVSRRRLDVDTYVKTGRYDHRNGGLELAGIEREVD